MKLVHNWNYLVYYFQKGLSGTFWLLSTFPVQIHYLTFLVFVGVMTVDGFRCQILGDNILLDQEQGDINGNIFT